MMSSKDILNSDLRNPLSLLNDQQYLRLTSDRERIEYVLKSGAPLEQIRKGIHEMVKNYIKDHRKHTINIESIEEEVMEESSEAKVWLHPNCCLRYSLEKGRHYFAKEFIPKGTVVHIEEPFSFVIKNKPKFCNNCREPVINKVWPCIGCDEVIFCSKKCSLNAYDKFHKYECGFSGLLEDSMKNFEHTFRIISRLGVRRVLDLKLETNYTDFDQFLPLLTNSEESQDFESLFKMFYSLSDNRSECESLETLTFICKSIETAILFDVSDQLDFDIEKDINSFVSLIEICMNISQKVVVNRISMIDKNPKEPIGSVVMLFGSLYNHNCVPNVFWTFNKQHFLAVSLRDIAIGEEMSISYGPSYLMTDFVERQRILRSDYFFSCKCDKCLFDRQRIRVKCLKTTARVD